MFADTVQRPFIFLNTEYSFVKIYIKPTDQSKSEYTDVTVFWKVSLAVPSMKIV